MPRHRPGLVLQRKVRDAEASVCLCLQEAAVLGRKVLVLDFVVPSPRGTSWGERPSCCRWGLFSLVLVGLPRSSPQPQRVTRLPQAEDTAPVLC